MIFDVLAAVALAVHLLFIVWVLLGALVTRNRPLLGWLHILSLIYGIMIQLAPWPCPLTLAEQFFQSKAGRTPYDRSFLVHYLAMAVYPNMPEALLVGAACAACSFNLALYLRRHYVTRARQPSVRLAND